MNLRAVLTAMASLLVSLQLHAELTVFAAASTTEVMKELAEVFKVETGEVIRFNFASSGALARQIDAGAPADLFVSANVKWMDWLEGRSAINSPTRFNLAANTLVMVAPLDSTLSFNGQIEGRLAVGDFKSVPAGMYAKEALSHMGWLDGLRPRLVMASNVRTALMYVERGEVAAGIVYATDAMASDKVSVVGTFPLESHSPMVYQAAACSKKPAVSQFLEFLKTDQVKSILKKHGFTEPTENIEHKDSTGTIAPAIKYCDLQHHFVGRKRLKTFPPRSASRERPRKAGRLEGL